MQRATIPLFALLIATALCAVAAPPAIALESQQPPDLDAFADFTVAPDGNVQVKRLVSCDTTPGVFLTSPASVGNTQSSSARAPDDVTIANGATPASGAKAVCLPNIGPIIDAAGNVWIPSCETTVTATILGVGVGGGTATCYLTTGGSVSTSCTTVSFVPCTAVATATPSSSGGCSGWGVVFGGYIAVSCHVHITWTHA